MKSLETFVQEYVLAQSTGKNLSVLTRSELAHFDVTTINHGIQLFGQIRLRVDLDEKRTETAERLRAQRLTPAELLGYRDVSTKKEVVEVADQSEQSVNPAMY